MTVLAVLAVFIIVPSYYTKTFSHQHEYLLPFDVMHPVNLSIPEFWD